MSSFFELGVSAPVVQALARDDIVEPFPVQELVLPDALAGRDVLAKSRTGSGKTLAFAIPIVERLNPSGARPAAVILAPTRELALQVTDDFVAIARARNLRVATVYGGVSLRDQAERAAKAHVIVATPGRLEDLANRKMLSLKGVEILILDEADRMLDMGFQPQVDRIVDRLPKKRQTMFFSATLDGQVGHAARSYTNNPIQHEVHNPKLTVAEADHRFVPVTSGDKVGKLIEILQGERSLALVFVRTKRGADRLSYKLKSRGVKAVAMHGDLTQAARKHALDRFKAGKVDVLIATDVAARGLDLDDITHVINFDPPEDDKGYVHRVGRTARAGRSGTGVTLVLPDQQADVSRVASRLQLSDDFEREGMTVAAPRVVFSSHGRRSKMRARTKRKF